MNTSKASRGPEARRRAHAAMDPPQLHDPSSDSDPSDAIDPENPRRSQEEDYPGPSKPEGAPRSD